MLNGLVLFVGIIFILWMGRSIFIPLLVATFMWYLINAISAYYRKVFPFTKPRGGIHPIPARVFDWTSNLLAAATIGGVIYLFITQIRPMSSELIAALPEMQTRIINLAEYISVQMGVKLDASLIPNISKIATNVGISAASIATTIGMIVVYMIFMFVEQSTFNRKFAAMFPNKRQSKKMSYIISSIDTNMKKYLFVKTFISAITGILSYVWLRSLGLEFAGVWAFIVFITSYIPTIGAIVACGLPILYSLINAPTLHQPVLVACGLIGLQIIFGNILEPKLTGKTLNLSTLAILINLVFWGMIWGIAGMFFSVPLLVATFIITAQFDSTRWIAVLLSADGKIPDKREE
ncbi:MAG: AI-2E family transporter [Alphaproteobacteria bacterium]|nr:AI-2E family transporter [Alphaproteobacteria bacterium]